MFSREIKAESVDGPKSKTRSTRTVLASFLFGFSSRAESESKEEKKTVIMTPLLTALLRKVDESSRVRSTSRLALSLFLSFS